MNGTVLTVMLFFRGLSTLSHIYIYYILLSELFELSLAYYKICDVAYIFKYIIAIKNGK